MDNPDYLGSFALGPRLDECGENWAAQPHNSKVPPSLLSSAQDLVEGDAGVPVGAARALVP